MKIKQFNWKAALFLIVYQSLFLITLPIYLMYETPSAAMWVVAFVLFWVTGISITGGYHRLYSHKTYQAHPILEPFILLFATMSCQGSALRWSYDHRVHHAFVDTDKDPYSIKKGFWFAHFLWILEKPPTIEQKVVPDLFKNKMVMLQHRFYPLWMVGTNAVATVLVGWLLNDYLGAVMLALFGRMFLLHHCTWFINSLAHTWGDKPFSQEQSAVDNYALSMLTFGEGYHNYHHTFANDYRNGIRWYHFDPTKWSIWFFSKFGLISNLKRADHLVVQKRIVSEHKDVLLEHIKGLWETKKCELEGKVNEISESLLDKFSSYRNSTCAMEAKRLERSIREEMKRWKILSRDVLKHKHPIQGR